MKGEEVRGPQNPILSGWAAVLWSSECPRVGRRAESREGPAGAYAGGWSLLAGKSFTPNPPDPRPRNTHTHTHSHTHTPRTPLIFSGDM